MLTSNGHTIAGAHQQEPVVRPGEGFRGHHACRSAPLVLIANPEVPAKTLKDFIAIAKAKPGTLNFSSPGVASTTFLAGAMFRKAAGVNMVHVPYKGAPDAVTAVVRGDAQMYFAPVNLVEGNGRGRQGHRDRVGDREAAPATAERPTFAEAGCRTSTIPGSA